jgi:hypothetical protein
MVREIEVRLAADAGCTGVTDMRARNQYALGDDSDRGGPGGAPLTGSLVTRRWSKPDSNSRSHPLTVVVAKGRRPCSLIARS